MNEITEVAERPAAGGCPQRSADDHCRRIRALVRPGRNEASAASAQDCRLSAEHPHRHSSPAARVPHRREEWIQCKAICEIMEGKSGNCLSMF